jgi:hypothetical protein
VSPGNSLSWSSPQRGARSLRSPTLLLIASIASLCACGGLALNPLTHERRSVHFELDASKSLTVVRAMTWTDKRHATHQLRFPAGIYTLEAEDADYFYMRSAAPLELSDFHKGGVKESHTLHGGIAIGKILFRAVPASGYIDGGESSRVLIWTLGKDFLGREGTDWRKSF